MLVCLLAGFIGLRESICVAERPVGRRSKLQPHRASHMGELTAYVGQPTASCVDSDPRAGETDGRRRREVVPNWPMCATPTCGMPQQGMNVQKFSEYAVCQTK